MQNTVCKYVAALAVTSKLDLINCYKIKPASSKFGIGIRI